MTTPPIVSVDENGDPTFLGTVVFPDEIPWGLTDEQVAVLDRQFGEPDATAAAVRRMSEVLAAEAAAVEVISPVARLAALLGREFGGPGSGPHKLTDAEKAERAAKSPAVEMPKIPTTVSELAAALNSFPSPSPDSKMDKATQDRLVAFTRGVGNANPEMRHVADAVGHWQSHSAPVRNAADVILGGGGFVSPHGDPGRPEASIEIDARALLDLVAAAEPVDATLYRALAMDEIPQPGQTIGDSLGSWSASDKVAGYVAEQRTDGKWWKPSEAATNNVILEVVNPRAVNISNLSSLSDVLYSPLKVQAQEYLAGGSYRVESVTQETRPRSGPDKKAGVWKEGTGEVVVNRVRVVQDQPLAVAASAGGALTIPAEEGGLWPEDQSELDSRAKRLEAALLVFGAPESGPQI